MLVDINDMILYSTIGRLKKYISKISWKIFQEGYWGSGNKKIPILKLKNITFKKYFLSATNQLWKVTFGKYRFSEIIIF